MKDKVIINKEENLKTHINDWTEHKYGTKIINAIHGCTFMGLMWCQDLPVLDPETEKNIKYT